MLRRGSLALLEQIPIKREMFTFDCKFLSIRYLSQYLHESVLVSTITFYFSIPNALLQFSLASLSSISVSKASLFLKDL